MGLEQIFFRDEPKRVNTVGGSNRSQGGSDDAEPVWK